MDHSNKAFIKCDGIYGKGDQALLLLHAQCMNLTMQDCNHYHQTFVGLSLKVLSQSLTSSIVFQFVSHNLNTVAMNMTMMHSLIYTVFKFQWTSGISIPFADVKKVYIELEECSSWDLFSWQSFEGANIASLNSNPLANSNRDRVQGQNQGRGQGRSYRRGSDRGQDQSQE